VEALEKLVLPFALLQFGFKIFRQIFAPMIA